MPHSIFHPDGYAGMGKICEFIYSCLTKILFLISISTFITFFTLKSFEPESLSYGKMGILRSTIFVDLLALVFFYPLIEIRNIIKRKKEEERKLLHGRIKQIEETFLLKGRLESNEFQEIENTFNHIKHIDAVPDWGIDSRQWLSLLGKFLLTFNGVALQILIKYINI